MTLVICPHHCLMANSAHQSKREDQNLMSHPQPFTGAEYLHSLQDERKSGFMASAYRTSASTRPFATVLAWWPACMTRSMIQPTRSCVASQSLRRHSPTPFSASAAPAKRWLPRGTPSPPGSGSATGGWAQPGLQSVVYRHAGCKRGVFHPLCRQCASLVPAGAGTALLRQSCHCQSADRP